MPSGWNLRGAMPAVSGAGALRASGMSRLTASACPLPIQTPEAAFPGKPALISPPLETRPGGPWWSRVHLRGVARDGLPALRPCALLVLHRSLGKRGVSVLAEGRESGTPARGLLHVLGHRHSAGPRCPPCPAWEPTSFPKGRWDLPHRGALAQLRLPQGRGSQD